MGNDAERLATFIGTAKGQQLDDAFIVALLKQNGWPERRIYGAFSAYYEGVLGAPLPSRGDRIEYARDAFFYLLAFISLSAWAIAVGNVSYVLVDRWLPSALDAPYALPSIRSQLSWELATIIVAFPIFMGVSRAIARQLSARPEGADSGVRKWLTYVALVVTATTLLGEAIWFLAAFLGGDLTTRFVAKALVLFALAGGIFAYYLGAVRTEGASPRRDRLFSGLAAGAVGLSLFFGFIDVGTPAHARDIAADQRRVANLSEIANALYRYRVSWGTKPSFRLPPTLAELRELAAPTDPFTHQPYEYRPLADTRYRLCATFATPSELPQRATFSHPAGRARFELDALKTYFAD
jgi:hypothetical protein